MADAIGDSRPHSPASAAARLQQLILDEVATTFGAAPDGLVRRICGSLFALPTGRFGRYFTAADREVGRAGLASGCGRLLSDMGIGVESRGAESLPIGSPLVVVANHPGAYDSVALASCVHRRDLKIFLFEVPFFRAIPNASAWFIYATNDPVNRMTALRATIRHLRTGGSVVLFGTGVIEPDPALGPGAITALAHWSRSVEIIMRQVPGIRLVLAAASGIMTPAFVHTPLRYVRRTPVDRRRVAEYLQVITQMVFPRWFRVTVRLSFAPPVTEEELARESGGRALMPAILERERRLLVDHRRAAGPLRAAAPGARPEPSLTPPHQTGGGGPDALHRRQGLGFQRSRVRDGGARGDAGVGEGNARPPRRRRRALR